MKELYSRCEGDPSQAIDFLWVVAQVCGKSTSLQERIVKVD